MGEEQNLCNKGKNRKLNGRLRIVRAMSTLISTDQVPAADRLEFVQEVAAATWVPMEFRPEHPAGCWGEFRVSGLGAMQVVVVDIMPVTVRRTPRLISRQIPTSCGCCWYARAAPRYWRKAASKPACLPASSPSTTPGVV